LNTDKESTRLVSQRLVSSQFWRSSRPVVLHHATASATHICTRTYSSHTGNNCKRISI